MNEWVNACMSRTTSHTPKDVTIEKWSLFKVSFLIGRVNFLTGSRMSGF
jgi:hypothetical protein